MDFGALQSKPSAPLCTSCPLGDTCPALHHHLVDTLPRKAKRISVRDRYLTYIYVRTRDGQTLLRRRGSGDIWQGLFEFPLIETANPSTSMRRRRPSEQTSGSQSPPSISWQKTFAISSRTSVSMPTSTASPSRPPFLVPMAAGCQSPTSGTSPCPACSRNFWQSCLPANIKPPQKGLSPRLPQERVSMSERSR